MSYHLNPATGRPGVCNATIACPFGSAGEHYATKEEARADYERQMELGAGPAVETKLMNTVKKLTPPLKKPEFSTIETFDYAGLGSLRPELPASDFEREPETLKTLNSYLRENQANAHQMAQLDKHRIIGAYAGGFTGTFREAIESGAVTPDSPSKLTGAYDYDLNRNAEATGYALGKVSLKAKAAFYDLPVAFLPAAVASTTGELVSKSHQEDLIKVATEVHKKDPSWRPASNWYAKAKAEATVSAAGTSYARSISGVTQEGHHLIDEYTTQKYGARKAEFWDTVKMGGKYGNVQPTLAAVLKASRAFDRKLALEA